MAKKLKQTVSDKDTPDSKKTQRIGKSSEKLNEREKELYKAGIRKGKKENGDLSQFIFGNPIPFHESAEAAVLGALLLDKKAFELTKRDLRNNPFYLDAHKTLYADLRKMYDKKIPIDIVSVTDFLKKKRHLKKIGGAYYLVELTNKVASAANIEYHCRILEELRMRRDGMKQVSDALQDFADMSKDVFDLYDNLNRKTRISNPNAMFEVQTMNEAILEGSKMEVRKKLCGSLIQESDVSVWFGGEGSGKSVLLFQVADAISKGKPLFNDSVHFAYELKHGLKSAIFDFELDKQDVTQRYADDKGFGYKKFNDNLFRIALSDGFEDMEKLEQSVVSQIEDVIIKHEIRFAVIDNMTYLLSESHDPTIATKFAKRIMNFSKRTGVTFAIVGHTPKRDSSLPIESRHLSGAKSLSNFLTSLIGIGISARDERQRYLKHLKRRKGGHAEFTAENVVLATIQKTGADLHWEQIGFGSEKDHLVSVHGTEAENERMEICMELYKAGVSWRKIAEAIDDYWSHMTVKRRILGEVKRREKEANKTKIVTNARNKNKAKKS